MQTSTEKQVAIVTGASSGIGKAIVQTLLKAGYVVHAAARRVDAMEELQVAGAHIHSLDLRQPEAIEAFVQEVLRCGSQVDLLINNAGYGAYGAIEDVPMTEARAQMEVNLFACAALMQQVLPVMRKQRRGRIINITSIGGKIWSPLGGWYHASKFALEGLSDCLRNEVRPFGIDVVVIEPGGVKTEWGGIAIENMMKTSGHGPYRPIAEAFAKLITGDAERTFAQPQEIADLVLHAATTARPRPRYVAPWLGRAILFLRRLLSDQALDFVFGKAFALPKIIAHVDAKAADPKRDSRSA